MELSQKVKQCTCPEIFGTIHQPRTFRVGKRIRCLARPVPRKMNFKFQPRSIKRYPRTIQVIRDQKISTRLEQLALPPVRCLIAARNGYKRFISRAWYRRFNQRIQKSLFTLYSRLANTSLQGAPVEKKKMTQEDWERHEKWLAKNARAKQAIVAPETLRKAMRIEILELRLETLSKPKNLDKKYLKSYKGPQKIPPNVLLYEATTRVKTLATPWARHQRDKFNILLQTRRHYVSRAAMKYKISERVTELSEAKQVRNTVSDLRENPFTVDPKALKAKANQRIIKLAKPKS